MEDLAALITALGPLVIGVLAYVIPPAANRVKARARGDDPSTTDYAADYIQSLKDDAAQAARIAALEAEKASLLAERERLLAAIARRDEKLRELGR